MAAGSIVWQRNRQMAGQDRERGFAMNRILIIDDDRELCVLIKRSVLSENIEADFCNTGKAGLLKLREREYQLVILDVMMPGTVSYTHLEGQCPLRLGHEKPYGENV